MQIWRLQNIEKVWAIAIFLSNARPRYLMDWLQSYNSRWMDFPMANVNHHLEKNWSIGKTHEQNTIHSIQWAHCNRSLKLSLKKISLARCPQSPPSKFDFDWRLHKYTLTHFHSHKSDVHFVIKLSVINIGLGFLGTKKGMKNGIICPKKTYRPQNRETYAIIGTKKLKSTSKSSFCKNMYFILFYSKPIHKNRNLPRNPSLIISVRSLIQ